MKRNRLLVLAAVLGVALLVPAGAYAQTTANIAVSASVAANCTITATAIAFGAYDPLGINAGTPLDATGSVAITCTKGSAPFVTLGTGGNPSATARQMSNGGGGLLEYQLYQNAGRTTVWGTGADALTAGAAPNKNARTFTVYGRVEAGLDPATGTYGDTVVATFNF
jgi:spore coat protein U-like protein